jgi:hypothetical protein
LDGPQVIALADRHRLAIVALAQPPGEEAA